jgi:hypothetical protein
VSSIRFKKLASLLVLLSLLGLNACAAVGSNVATLGDLFASEGKRSAALDSTVSRYYQARYWGGNQETLSFVQKDQRSKISRQLRQEEKGARFVDYEVEDVQLLDDANIADVTVSVRYFRTGSMVMEKRIERQNWKYHRFAGGWLVHDTQIVEYLGATDDTTAEIRGRL